MAITVYEREICDSDGKEHIKARVSPKLQTSDLRPQKLKSRKITSVENSNAIQTQTPSSNHRTCNLRSYGELSDNFDKYRISVYCIAKIKQNMEGMRLTT